MGKIKVGIGVWDIHHPQYIKRLWDNILRVTRMLKPDFFVFGGDNMDCMAASHWLKDHNKTRQREGLRMVDEYKAFEKEILTPANKALPKNARKIFLKGNHEVWIDDVIGKDPQTHEGFLELENNLNLAGWEIYEYGQHAKIGKAHFIHGQYTNDHHAKKTVTTYERNVFYGHSHTKQIYTKITPVDNESHSGVSVPCVCHRNPEFMRNKPNSWMNGFLVFYILPSGHFDHIIVTANEKGQFIFYGKAYD